MLLSRRLASAAVLAGVCLPTGLCSAQQFVQETATRFPSPGPLEYTNQATVGDIDSDGDLDIIFANGGGFSSAQPPQTQRVYVNNGSGTFTDESAARLGFSGICRGVELGDCDNDGDLDMIFAQDFERQPMLFINDGTGNFANETAARLPAILLSSARGQFGDIDNDGDLDLFFTTGQGSRFGCDQYRLFENDGTGHYTDVTLSQFPIGSVCQNQDCIFGDIDNDFDLDIRTAGTGSNNSRLYVNDGSGTYTLDASPPNDSSCYSYDFGDIEGDGDLDMIGVNALAGSSSELLLRNNPLGTFTNISPNIVPNPSQDDNDSKFLDWDNDGDLDLIIGRLGGPTEKPYVNNGFGTFNQDTSLISSQTDSTLDIMVADVDNDGDVDIITAQGESGNFTNRIYINNGPADTIPPTIVQTEQMKETEDTTGPYVIRALILDGMSSDRNFFDDGITLNYTTSGGAGTSSVDMMYSGGQVYRGEIPGQPSGTTVSYFVEATDYNGNTGVGETLEFTVGGEPSPADLDGDGSVGPADLALLLGDWGPCGDPKDCPADLDGDGTVGPADLAQLLGDWG